MHDARRPRKPFYLTHSAYLPKGYIFFRQVLVGN